MDLIYWRDLILLIVGLLVFLFALALFILMVFMSIALRRAKKASKKEIPQIAKSFQMAEVSSRRLSILLFSPLIDLLALQEGGKRFLQTLLWPPK